MRIIALIFCLATAAPTEATEWQSANGGEIEAALSGRTVSYGSATQVFYASGKTLYDAGQPSWGYWRVEGDTYCSQWPPAESWTCYRVEYTSDGTSLRFIDAQGRTFYGVFVAQ